MGIGDRIGKLESSLPSEECPLCHDPQYVVFVRDEPRPEPCPKCGKKPKFVVEACSEEGRQYVRRLFAGELPKPATNTEEVPE